MNASVFKLAASAAALSAGLFAATSAYADPVAEFSVNHTVLSGQVGCPGAPAAGCGGVFPGAGADFRANQITGNASTLITDNTATGGSISATGWINLTGFTLNNNSIGQAITLLGSQYDLWGEFSYTLVPVTGAFGVINSSYTVTNLTFSLYGMTDPNALLLGTPGANIVFTSANAATNTAATVNVLTGTRQLLGTATSVAGVAGINNEGGAFFNSTVQYQNTALGDQFFVDPVPFYNMAFDQFNNTQQGLQIVDNRIAITQSTGSIDFTRPLPEPGSLALVGLAIAGLGFAGRRRAK